MVSREDHWEDKCRKEEEKGEEYMTERKREQRKDGANDKMKKKV